MPLAQSKAPTTIQHEHWTDSLRSAIKSVDELLAVVELERHELVDEAIVDTGFPLRVPRGFAARMRKRDPRDPLLRQVLPIIREREPAPGFVTDPLDEVARSRRGIIRKYSGRALLVTTAACPIHCRYCFRRHYPYAEQNASKASWATVLEELATATDIDELILSGGDPLTLSNRRLKTLVDGLDSIDHIKALRIHTRYPIVLPTRVDAELLVLLEQCRPKVVVVVHCNHPQEIDESVERALGELRARGVTLLNQSVLLRGVNDDLATLRALSRRLFDVGVLPYYLHALDRVAGSAHFEVPEHDARALATELRQALPGYLVPRLARESAGQSSKTILI